MGKAYLTAAQWWAMRKNTNMPIDRVRTSCWSLTISLKEGSGNTLESIKALCTTFTETHKEAAICFSEEEGKAENESGEHYRHAQMAIHVPKRITGTQMKEAWAATHAHIEPAKNQTALIKYVQKKETHVSGPYTFGAWEDLCKRNANRGERTDLNAINNAIDSGMKYTDIMLDAELSVATLSKRRYILDRIEARSCQQYGNKNRSPFKGDYRISVDYMWGPTGTGKTASVYETYGYENVFAINDYTNTTFLFDGYNSEPVLLLDEYKSNIRFKDLLTILYGNPLRLNIKGGHTYAAWTKVIMCSSVPITEQYTGKLGEGDGSICQLYRRMAHGRVVHMDGKNHYPYADAPHAMMGEWDDAIGESQSITQATGIDWETGETIPGITNPEIRKHQQRYEWNND